MNKLTAPFAAAALLMIGSILLAILMAWPTQWLWNNCLAPAVSSLNQIEFWQALGINVLSSILFRSNVTTKSKK